MSHITCLACRFYFLSNDELLEILAQTKNVQAVQPHMGKCFDGIRRLDFGDDPKSTDIFAMVSGEARCPSCCIPFASLVLPLLSGFPPCHNIQRKSPSVTALCFPSMKMWHESIAAAAPAGEGERVSFGKNPLKARNSVEQWLGTVESGMVASLRRLAKQGMASYPEEPRSDWVLRQPVQLVLAVSQVYWCAAVEEQLRSAGPHDGLTAFYQVGCCDLVVVKLGHVTCCANTLYHDLVCQLLCRHL